MDKKDCVIWKGPSQYGYGIKVWKVNGKWKNLRAHRWAWAQEKGEIPEGKQVNHRCGVSLCVNVEHLYLGTQAENMRDRQEHGTFANQNTRKTHCPYGHPYSGDNLRMRPGGGRACKACEKDAGKRARERKRNKKEG